MNKKILFLFVLLLLIESCKNPTGVDEINPVILNPDRLTAVKFNLASYNLIEIKSDTNFYLNSKRVTKILIGKYLNGNIIVSDSLNPEYIQKGNDVVLSFNGQIFVDDSVLNYDAGVRLRLKDSADVILHKEFSMLTAEYKTARLVTGTAAITNNYILDFYYSYPLFYYRTSKDNFLYEYNFKTGQSRKLFSGIDYGFGFNLDADSSYLFFDAGYSKFIRYSIKKDSVDRIVTAGTFNCYGAGIIDTVVYFATQYEYGIKLRSYTFDLQPINSIPLYAGDISNLTNYKGKFLTVLAKSKLASFDAGTGHFYGNPTAPLPTKFTDAIKVNNDSLYFYDYKKKCIGVVPVKDVFPGL